MLKYFNAKERGALFVGWALGLFFLSSCSLSNSVPASFGDAQNTNVGSALYLTGPSGVPADTCAPAISIAFLDASGEVAANNTAALVSFSGMGHGSIYLDSNCLTAASQVSIAANTVVNVLYFKDPVVENLNLSASASGFSPGAFALSVLYTGAPEEISVSPSVGPVGGGTNITIAGNYFSSGSTVFLGGDPCTVTLALTAEIICTTPAHSVGPVDLLIQNPDGQSVDTAAAFIYQTAPVVSSVSPIGGPPGGGTVISIYGSNFSAGATVAVGGVPCGGVDFLSSSQLTCTTGATSAGSASIVVTNLDSQMGTLGNAFSYESAPSISFLSPTGGPLAGGATLSIAGTGFLSGASVSVGTSACTNVVVASATSVTCTTPANATAGSHLVLLTNPDGQDSSANYIYNAAPTLTSLSPAAGPLAGNITTTLTGTGFISGASVTIGGSACANVVVNSSTSLTCKVPAGTGAANITVTNFDGQIATLSAGFNYDVAPTFSSVSPLTSLSIGGTLLTITGTGFVSGSTVSVGGACSVLSTSSTQIECTTSPATGGYYSLIITNPDGQSVSASNAVLVFYSPTVTSLSPATGPATGGTLVNVIGTNLDTPDLSVSVGGNPCSGLTKISSTEAQCTVAAHAGGAANVTVSDGAGNNTLVGGFTYTSAPTLSGVSPSAGPLAGGNTLSVTGQNFASGALVSVGGNACSPVTVVSSTALTCVLSAGSGLSGVTVTNMDTQSASLSNVYTYEPAPTVTSISPSFINSSGGTLLTLTGTNFMTGATVTVGGSACTSPSVVSSTSITCTAPAHASGAVNVVVKNTDTQTGTLSNGLTFDSPPTVTSASPIGGPAAGGTLVTLSGTNFMTGASVSFGGASCTPVVFNSSTSLTCTAPSGTVGTAVNVVVTNTDTETGTLTTGYTYRNAPTVGSVSPVIGAITGGNSVVISGTGFFTGAAVSFGGTAATGVAVSSATQLTAITPAHATGAVTVVVTNLDTQTGTLSSGYTFSGLGTPTITAISPIGGNTAGGTLLTLTGTNFAAGASIQIGGVSCGSVNVISATSANCVTPSGSTGPVSLTFTNTDAQTASYSSFTYAAAPTVLSITPQGGSLGGGTLVNIIGTGFQSGATVSIGGASCTGVTTQSPWTSLNCQTSSQVGSTYNVVVTNPDTQFGSLTNGYTYRAAPTVTSVVPPAGSPSGGTAVTVTGTGFINGATVTMDSICGSVTVVSPTSITCATVATGSGNYNVVVTNPDSQMGTLSNGYAFTTGPEVTGISPTYGPPAGGTDVTLTGGSFLSGATVSIGGVQATSVNVVSNTQITATTGTHAAANVNVVVTNPNALTGTLTNGFNYTTAGPPVVTGTSPNTGSVNGGQTIAIQGSAFQSGATAYLGGVACAATSYVSSSQLDCTSPAGNLGAVTVQVTNADSQMGSLSSAFTYVYNPTVTTVNPGYGPYWGGTSITITGTGFTAGATVTLGTVSCSSVSVTSSTSLTCTTGASTAGAVTVTVATPANGSGSLAVGFTYDGPPTLVYAIPPYGTASGGNTLTLMGAGYLSGATVSVGGTPCLTVGFISPFKLTCDVPAGSNGFANIVITNPDTQSVTWQNGYQYGTPVAWSGISTFAGTYAPSGSYDGDGSDATNVRMVFPSRVYTDGTYVYVSDTTSYTIRRITINTGATLTLAGSAGISGCAAGTGSQARFDSPEGITSDGTNLYVVDNKCSTVYEISLSTNEVTVLAGPNTLSVTGLVDATGSAARFNTPAGITYANGMLYIADTGNYAIRELNPSTGAVITIAGGTTGGSDGTGTAAQFQAPTDLTTDGSANLYISDDYTVRQLVLSTDAVITLAGMYNTAGNSNGTGSAARFSDVAGLAYSEGTLFISGYSNENIQVLDLSNDEVTTLFGGGYGYEDGPLTDALLYHPTGIATNDGIHFYIADNGNYAIRSVNLDSETVSTLVGYNQGLDLQATDLNDPAGYVGLSYEQDGNRSNAQFGAMRALTTDGTNFYAADYYTIREISPSGTVSTLAGEARTRGYVNATGTVARFEGLTGIATDGQSLFVTESGSCTLRSYSLATGIVSTVAGQNGNCGAVNGTGTSATLDAPFGLISDGQFVYWVEAHGSYDLVRKMNIATSAVTTLAGTSAYYYQVIDGTGTAAAFASIGGMTLDGTNLWVTDYCTVRKIVIATGAVTTVAGKAGGCGATPTDSTGTAAVLGTEGPTLATDGVNLYFTDGHLGTTGFRQMNLSTYTVTTLTTNWDLGSKTVGILDLDGTLSTGSVTTSEGSAFWFQGLLFFPEAFSLRYLH